MPEPIDRLAAARRRSLLVAWVLPVAACCGREDDFLAQIRHFADEDDGHPHPEGNARDFVEPLDAPTWVAAGDAGHMRPEDPVVGFATDAGAWAIPWWIFKNHHVANLTLGGTDVCIVLCERCSSAAAFDPIVDGKRLNLSVAGIYDGTHVCRDAETGTWWTPFLGEGMHGPLKGRFLRRLRVDQASWDEWRELHPATVVALGDESQRYGHGRFDLPGAPMLTGQMRESIRHLDPRLSMNELVLGVVVNEEPRAYPIAAIHAADGRIEDDLGGIPIVVLSRPGGYFAAAFERVLDGVTLRFFVESDGTLRDDSTRSAWDVAGRAHHGPLAGRALEPVIYSLDEWYIWATQHPDTSIHGEE